MKKFILTEDEKKSIRKLYYLNEQYAAIEALFGKNLAKTASTNMSDDIVRELEKKSAKILQNSKVITQEGGQLFLLSASGAKVSAKTLSDALDAVMTGKLPKSAVINYFPRQLADGTEFRSFFDSARKNLKSRGGASATASAVKLGQVGLQFKQMYSKAGWVQTHQPTSNMSGWKFHVFSDNLDDAAYLFEKLDPVVRKWGAGMKIGGGDMYTRSIGTAGTTQYGKGTTIYVPSSVFAKNAQKEFLKDIESAISGYKSSGTISGDKMINKNIGYRYELSKPIDTKKGVTDSEYQVLYSSNQGGSHKPNNVEDMFK